MKICPLQQLKHYRSALHFYGEREKELYYEELSLGFWRQRNAMIGHLQAGDSGEPVTSFSLSLEA